MRKVMSDLIFEVTQEADGGFVAECLTEPIVTQGDSWEGLREAVNEAVRGYFFDSPGHSCPPAFVCIWCATRALLWPIAFPLVPRLRGRSGRSESLAQSSLL